MQSCSARNRNGWVTVIGGSKEIVLRIRLVVYLMSSVLHRRVYIYFVVMSEFFAVELDVSG